MKRLFTAALLLSGLALAGCASLSEEQCAAGNWEEIGRRDGANGRTASYLANHSKACADLGIQPDAALWEAGRQQGLQYYCTPENAYREARNFYRSVAAVCPASPALERAYRDGLEWRRLEDRIDDEKDDIRDAYRHARRDGRGFPQAAAALARMDIQQYRMRQRMIDARY
ncbi:DUF2799 domain-containing protein [Paracoccaceae bacterium GXU_MW_L88]